MGRVEGKEIDSETMGLAIREETGWERRMRKIRESTFMGPLVQTVETIAEVQQQHWQQHWHHCTLIRTSSSCHLHHLFAIEQSIASA
jgi:hypothetical protein